MRLPADAPTAPSTAGYSLSPTSPSSVDFTPPLRPASPYTTPCATIFLEFTKFFPGEGTIPITLEFRLRRYQGSLNCFSGELRMKISNETTTHQRRYIANTTRLFSQQNLKMVLLALNVPPVSDEPWFDGCPPQPQHPSQSRTNQRKSDIGNIRSCNNPALGYTLT